MTPFQPVVVDEAGDEIVTQIAVEAGVILVGIAERLPHWRERVPCICAVDHAECDQRHARQQNFLHHLAPSCHYSAVLAHVPRWAWEQSAFWVRKKSSGLGAPLHKEIICQTLKQASVAQISNKSTPIRSTFWQKTWFFGGNRSG